MEVSVNLNSLKLGDKITLSTYGGTDIQLIQDVTVRGFASYSYLKEPTVAQAYHADIYPEIPSGSYIGLADSPDSYDYIILENVSTGEVYEVGQAWIVPTTVVRTVTGHGNIQIIGVDAGQLANAVSLLRMYGYNVGVTGIESV